MKNKEIFIGIDKADDNKQDEVNVTIVDKDGNTVAKLASFEPNIEGHYYDGSALSRMVDRIIEERRKNKRNMKYNQHGGNRLRLDDLNGAKLIPNYLIRNFVTGNKEFGIKATSMQYKGGVKMEHKSMGNIIEELTKHKLIKMFVSNVVDTYEQSKYENFYTKGIIYDSVDRELSKNVINSILSSDFECVVKGNSSVELIMNDVYTTRIKVSIEEGQVFLNVNARGMFCPKINKQAMELVALTMFNKLSN